MPRTSASPPTHRSCHPRWRPPQRRTDVRSAASRCARAPRQGTALLTPTVVMAAARRHRNPGPGRPSGRGSSHFPAGRTARNGRPDSEVHRRNLRHAREHQRRTRALIGVTVGHSNTMRPAIGVRAAAPDAFSGGSCASDSGLLGADEEGDGGGRLRRHRSRPTARTRRPASRRSRRTSTPGTPARSGGRRR